MSRTGVRHFTSIHLYYISLFVEVEMAQTFNSQVRVFVRMRTMFYRTHIYFISIKEWRKNVGNPSSTNDKFTISEHCNAVPLPNKLTLAPESEGVNIERS